MFIGEAFAFEYLDFWPAEGERWEVLFGAVSLGLLAPATARFLPRRRGKVPLQLSYHPTL